jgi:ectoine hydroxylase-related dioxygenase (phytanoyl-CoA dioxygenase family)
MDRHRTKGNRVISDRDVAFYRQNGYLLVEKVLDPSTRVRMKEVIAELVAKAKGVAQHNDVYDLEPTHTPEAPRVRRIKKPHVVNPIFWDFAKSPPLLEVVRKLLGPNIRLHGSKLNMKDPKYGSAVEWHQDWAFYPHTNDDLLAIGVMLDDVELENGPLMVLPGTHKGPVYDHHADGRFCGAIDPAVVELRYDMAVPVTGKAGSASFHHVRLVHGSAQNTSSKPRQLLLYECGAADAWPLVNFTNLEEYDSRMLCGRSTIEPRVEKVPIRMPFPPALNPGSIYENQTSARRRYFEQVEVAPAK